MIEMIDFHAHVLDPDVYARTINHNVITGFGARPQSERPAPSDPRYGIYARMTDRALHVADMDRLGSQVHVISIATTSQGSGWADRERRSSSIALRTTASLHGSTRGPTASSAHLPCRSRMQRSP